MSLELGRFGVSRMVFPVEGLRGFSTFGDSLLVGIFFVGKAEGISWGTLHGGSQINNK
jgi:hypothetical protein